MSTVKIMLVANAGILIEYQDQQVLIDALHEGHRLYPGTPSEAMAALIEGKHPFKHLQALVFTHNHVDHFSARMTLAALQHHPETQLIADEATIDAFLDLSASITGLPDRERIRIVTAHADQHTQNDNQPCTYALADDNQQPSTNSLAKPYQIVVPPFTFTPIRFEHEGRRFADIVNIGFLVTVGGLRILYPGDARISAENYASLACIQDPIQNPIDAAVLMFPYVSTGRGQSLIRDVIRPRRLIVVHWPDPDRDTQNFIGHAHAYFERTKDSLMETVLLKHYQDTIEISAE